MWIKTIPCVLFVFCTLMTSCAVTNFVRGGIYRQLDQDLTIVKLMQDPRKYLDKEIVFSIRYYQTGDLPCPLGPDYVNFSIADRVSYITLNKVWIKKEDAEVLTTLEEMETIVMRARVFQVDEARDPNLEALEIAKE